MRTAPWLYRGVSLVEVLVVLAILAVLLGLLFPAVHFARESARRTQCENNLHQMAIALTHFVDVRRKLPEPNMPGTMGGWAVAILPFLEDQALAKALDGNPPLESPAALAHARRRPTIMSCPSVIDDESDPGIPRSHYTAQFKRHTKVDQNKWTLGELRFDRNIVWVASPELPIGGLKRNTPHGGFHSVSGFGANAYGVWFAPSD